MIFWKSPAGSSAPHHWANSSVTVPPDTVSLEVPEPHAAAKATSEAAVTAPITRFSRVARTAITAPLCRDPSVLCHVGATLAACYRRGQEKNSRKLRSTAYSCVRRAGESLPTPHAEQSFADSAPNMGRPCPSMRLFAALRGGVLSGHASVAYCRTDKGESVTVERDD